MNKKTIAKKKPTPAAPRAVKLDPTEALELRMIEFSVVAAPATNQTTMNLRKTRSETIAKAHGIDITTGSWHLGADTGTIPESLPKE